jgi:hypothetical protein
MRQILFFALKDDLLPVFSVIENERSLVYTKTGLFKVRDLVQLRNGSAIPNLGSADADSSIACETYLIVEQSNVVETRSIRQLDGTVRYGVDQLVNHDTVTLTTGGEWLDGTILSGRIATASDTVKSQELIKAFNSAIRKNFRKVNSYWIGPSAYARLQAGSRLTDAVGSPSEYDLVG